MNEGEFEKVKINCPVRRGNITDSCKLIEWTCKYYSCPFLFWEKQLKESETKGEFDHVTDAILENIK